MNDLDSDIEVLASAAIEALTALELPQLVYATVSLINIPFGDLVIDDSAVTASYALSKVAQYLRALRHVESRRREIGLQARRQLAHAEEVRAADPILADSLMAEAILGAAEQEVEWHFFTICAAQVRRLLKLAARIVGRDLPDENEQILDSYQPLRNLFEHLDERLPGNERGGRLVLEESDSTKLLIGLKSDDVGRFTVQRNGDDVVAEVNNVGVWQIEQVVNSAFEDIRTACVELLRDEFAQHPEKIPTVESIQNQSLTRRRLLE